jgi:cytochrome c553
MYLDTQLKAFRTGKRPSEIMSDIAGELSNADIRLVADWFAQISFEVDIPN